jgi:hypothetical protein
MSHSGVERMKLFLFNIVMTMMMGFIPFLGRAEGSAENGWKAFPTLFRIQDKGRDSVSVRYSNVRWVLYCGKKVQKIVIRGLLMLFGGMEDETTGFFYFRTNSDLCGQEKRILLLSVRIIFYCFAEEKAKYKYEIMCVFFSMSGLTHNVSNLSCIHSACV